MLSETTDTFLQKESCCFVKGKYKDVIRMVYDDLLMLVLSTRDVQKVIRSCS